MDRADGLAENIWLEFEQLKWSKSPALRAEFRDDFQRYWSWLQNQHRSAIYHGVCRSYVVPPKKIKAAGSVR